MFQGAQLRCALCDPLGGELVAHLEADEPRPGVAPGAALWLSWPVDAARLIPPEPAADAAPEPATGSCDSKPKRPPERSLLRRKNRVMRLRSDRSPAAGVSDAISHSAQGVAGLPARRATNTLGIDR